MSLPVSTASSCVDASSFWDDVELTDYEDEIPEHLRNSADVFKLIQKYLGSIQNVEITKQYLASSVEQRQGRYIGKRFFDDDLTFVMERLTDANLQTWFSLSERSWDGHGGLKSRLQSLKDPNWTKEQVKYIESVDRGALAFRNTLFRFEELRGEERRPEVWISYVLSGERVDPLEPIDESQFHRIEMVVTTLTHSVAPVVVHIGIGRTIYNLACIFKRTLSQHAHLSIPLHAFTAKAMQMTLHGATKKWMITQPTLNMGAIFEEALDRTSYKKGMVPPLPQKTLSDDEELTIQTPDGGVVATYSEDHSLRHNLAFLYHKDMIPDSTLYYYAVDYSILAGNF